MTNVQPLPRPAPPALLASAGSLLLSILPAVSLAAILSLLLWLAVGPTLGLFFGGIGIVTLIAPALLLAEPDWGKRLLVAATLVVVVAGSWIAAVAAGPVTFGEWIRTALILGAVVLLLLGLPMMLVRLRFHPSAAAAATVVLSLAWLSWPIWMSPHLRGRAGEETAAALVAAHPLFAANSALRDTFPVPWPQHRLAYRLTNLGDDIIYVMPRGVAPCVVLHGGGGLILLGLVWMPAAFRRAAAP